MTSGNPEVAFFLWVTGTLLYGIWTSTFLPDKCTSTIRTSSGGLENSSKKKSRTTYTIQELFSYLKRGSKYIMMCKRYQIYYICYLLLTKNVDVCFMSSYKTKFLDHDNIRYILGGIFSWNFLQ